MAQCKPSANILPRFPGFGIKMLFVFNTEFPKGSPGPLPELLHAEGTDTCSCGRDWSHSHALSAVQPLWTIPFNAPNIATGFTD